MQSNEHLSSRRQAALDEELRLELELAHHRSKQSLLAFTRATMGVEFIANWHHKAVCRALTFLREGRTHRELLATWGIKGKELERQLTTPHPVTKLYAGLTHPDAIDSPLRNVQAHFAPRHGKSEIVSRRAPAWFMGHNPNEQIIATSYGAALSEAMNRDVQRIMTGEEYLDLFPRSQLFGKNVRSTAQGSYIRNSECFEIVGHKGRYKNAGVGGPITGHGATCVTGDAKVLTERGEMRIADFWHTSTWPKVWGYNVHTGKRQLCKVKAVRRKTASQLVTTSFSHGCAVTSTPEHLFFAAGVGYRQAQNLAGKERSAGPCEDNCSVCGVRGTASARYLKCSVKVAGAHQTDVLQPQMWGFGKPALPIQIKAYRLPRMRQRIYAGKQHTKAVFDQVRERLALACHDGGQQPYLQTRSLSHEICRQPVVLSAAQTHQDAGWGSMRAVLPQHEGARTGPCASYRPRSNERYAAQSDHNLQFVSFDGAQTQHVRLEKITAHREGQFEVFDIEVDVCGNFYANNVVIKNCALIDDPFKNREDADSPVKRQTVMDWYNSTLYTRLEREAKQILVNTRWHERDLSGSVIEKARADPKAEQWFCLVFPALLDSDPTPGDMRTKDGQALWPWKADEARLGRIKATTSAYEWESLFQQRPAPPEGGIVKLGWFQYWDKLPDGLQGWTISGDLTFKDRGDYMVLQVWAAKGADHYLIDQIRDRLPFTGQLRAFKSLCQKYPQARLKLIEDAANGAALIDTVKREINGVVGVRVGSSKELRLDAVSPMIEAGNVHLPNPRRAPWVEYFLNEISNFPAGAHDDMIDAASLYLGRVQKRRSYSSGGMPIAMGKQSHWHTGAAREL